MTKRCSHCKLEKADVEFYKNRSQRDGLSIQCRICTKSMVRQYQTTEHGKLSIKHHRMTDDYKRAEKLREERYRVKKNQQHARYKKTDHGILVSRQADRRRRERKHDLDMQFTHEDVKLVHERFEHKCFNCGRTNRLQIDHHFPLSRGHGLLPSNAVLLCKSCNSSKNNRLPENFYSIEQLEKLNALGIIRI